jgi:hypothetical protein
MLSVVPLCAWEAYMPFTSSYDGGGGMLFSALGVGGASIRCRSDVIY